MCLYLCFVVKMYSAIIFFVFATSSTSWSKVITDEKPSCSSITEFACGDGSCVRLDRYCDGVLDCGDGSDEETCDVALHEEQVSYRYKRQATCGKEQSKCRDGTCISMNYKCNGVRDCPDGSDETFVLCRKAPCQSNQFRCTYGACVDGKAPCNNVQDCADNSDELLRRCRNQTEEVRGTFKCDNGQEIEAFGLCDGAKHCTDGSDETLKACAGNTCPPYQFHCAYGACVGTRLSAGAFICNDIEDCADGSDESDELCNRLAPITVPSVTQTGGSCVLPPYPPKGHYRVSTVPGAVPGQNFFFVGLNITCDPGYRHIGTVQRLCVDGVWQPSVVTNNECALFCRLDKDPSVRFRCLLTGNSDGSRECNEYEPEGTLVAPACNAPNYHHMGYLRYMRCINGQWDNIARCYAVCGRVVPAGIDLIVGGRPAELGELPWHAGIYRKTTTPFMQICGGSLVSSKVVISAAHCFWDDTTKAQPASNYAVALGKLYRPWAYQGDTDVQRSDVADIKITRYFQGRTANFQEDIAIVLLVSVIEFRPHIRPVCVDFSVTFEDRQLSPGNKGKVAGWGLAEENGNPSQFLKVVELPVISIQECQTDSPSSFKELITADKFCAGFRNGTAVCKGDSGGGLTFPDTEQGYLRYYLRGIVSTAPKAESLCNANWLTTFTLISRHEKFILKYL